MRRIAELDGIRAFAILAVIGCHYYPFGTMLVGIPQFGWAGVELFFVLSGFLITTILLQLKTGPHPYKVFYLRRMLRIFPPYYALLALVIIIAALEHDSLPWARFGQAALFLQSFNNTGHIMTEVGHVITGQQAIPDLLHWEPLQIGVIGFPISNFSTSYSHTWSLSVEEWFYILWAPMVLKLTKRTLVVSCICASVAALLIRWSGFQGVNTYFNFFSRIDVLMGGALLALWWAHRQDLPIEKQKYGDRLIGVAALASAALLLVTLFWMRPVLGREIRASLPFSVFGLPLLGVCLAGSLSYVVRNAGTPNWICRVLRAKPLVQLGLISYMLYLAHVPIYFLVTQAASRLGVPSGVTVSLVSAALAIGFSMLSFRYFEMPVVRYKDQLTRQIVGELERQSPPSEVAPAA